MASINTPIADSVYCVYVPDSVGLYLEIHQAVLRQYGLSCRWGDVIAEMGHTALETAENICRKKCVPDTPENYRDKVADMQETVFPNCNLIKGRVFVFIAPNPTTLFFTLNG